MKKVISFALWGNNPVYTVGAVRNAELAQSIYPDWICRFYVGKMTPIDSVVSLCYLDNTEIYIMNEKGDWNGMFWRFLPPCDPTVDITIVRDVDSRLSYREKHAVDEWLDGDKDFHIMRDHPHHRTEILGGMWGVKSPCLNNINELIDEFDQGNHWQTDQIFLTQLVYPLIIDNVCIHDEYFDKIPFPTERFDGEFVGQQFDENDKIITIEH